ncbi:MAG: hypothetical protein U1F47_00080 [Hyphomicrobiales bacterium]
MIAHLALRLVLVLAGYAAGATLGAALFPLLLTLLGLVFPDSNLWDWMGLGTITLIVMPMVFVFIVLFVIVTTYIQAFVVCAATEALALRQAWLHIAAAIAVMLSGVLFLDSSWFQDLSRDRLLITLCACLAAAAGGTVYWAIAGRNAGLTPLAPKA